MMDSLSHVPVREGVTPDAVATLLARWRAAGTWFVVLDERGRHAEQLRAGRLDLSHSPDLLTAAWIGATMHRTGYALLDASNVPRRARPGVIGRALAAVQLLRTQSDGPEWVVIEDAQDVLRRSGIPPHALRLSDGGYCLAARGGVELPAPVRVAFDIRISRPGLDVTLIPGPGPGPSGGYAAAR